LREALKSVLDSQLPNLVQMDVSTLAGILAERLLAHVPYLDKVFFLNSGSEAVEAAIKFARVATGRPGIVYCEHAFHGLSCGALSLNGGEIFRSGFEPLLPVAWLHSRTVQRPSWARAGTTFADSRCIYCRADPRQERKFANR
jgi:ornithine--oxo-acid transaminase